MVTKRIDREIRESATVLGRVLGKRLVNLPIIEKQLGCSLDANLSIGLLQAFCCKSGVKPVENLLQAEVENVKHAIRNETFEHAWLRNTRLVIGSGYQICSILFAREFDTFYIYNLSRNWTRETLKTFVHSKIDNPDKISNLQIIYQDNRSTAKIKLKKPADAVLLMEEMKNYFIEENTDVCVAPQLGNVSPEALKKTCTSSNVFLKTVDVKLKITWPLGPSTGNVIIFLKSPEDGNRVIDILPGMFGHNHVITYPVGGQTYTGSINERMRGGKAFILKIQNCWKFSTHIYDVSTQILFPRNQ